MTTFAPTHEITINGRAIQVQLVDGVAYTREEWEAESAADWERQADGTWTFQGEVPAGAYSVAALAAPVECACGAATGERCAWRGPEAEMVAIEFMPRELRASHEAARNHGRWPDNGALRLRVSRDCAGDLVDGDEEWCSIVEENH